MFGATITITGRKMYFAGCKEIFVIQLLQSTNVGDFYTHHSIKHLRDNYATQY